MTTTGANEHQKLLLCAQNNVDLYKSVFQAHALTAQSNDSCWWCDESAPPYYSNLVTLDPDAATEQLQTIERLKSTISGTIFVKDSFHSLDLSSHGFSLLFPSTWIWADARPNKAELPKGWIPVTDSEALAKWEEAWTKAGNPSDKRVFPPSILRDGNMAFFGRVGDHGFDGGCIANKSPSVVGMSNVFNLDGTPSAVREAVSAVSSAFEGNLPIVGYEGDDTFEELRGSGFSAAGKLRVWMRAA